MIASQPSQAAPVVPQVWLDEQGQIFAIAFEGTSDQELNIMSKQAIPTEEEEDDDDEDGMYTSQPASAVVILPDPSLKDKIINYVNTMMTYSPWFPPPYVLANHNSILSFLHICTFLHIYLHQTFIVHIVRPVPISKARIHPSPTPFFRSHHPFSFWNGLNKM